MTNLMYANANPNANVNSNTDPYFNFYSRI